MKKYIAIILVALMTLSLLAGCSNNTANTTAPAKDDKSTAESASETITIRIAHNSAEKEEDPYQYTAKRFQELVEERTGGKVKVQIYPGGQYGGEREMFEAVTLGTVEMAVMTSGNISQFSPAFLAADLPFIFESSEAAWKALDGPAGQAIGNTLQSIGVIGLGWGENGFRNMVTNGRGIAKAGDFSGMKVRSLENELHVASYKAWGANPSPLAWAEVMTGMQQGTIEGLDIPIAVAYSGNFSSLAKYYSLTGQFYNAQYVVGNLAWFKGLSPELQEVVKQSVLDACNAERQMLIKNQNKWLEAMKADGMTIITADQIDFESFKSAVSDIYDKYAKTVGGTYVYDLTNAAKEAAAK